MRGKSVTMTRWDVCKGPHCHAEICWVKMPSGRWVPFDPGGISHWTTCPDAESFKAAEEGPQQLDLFTKKGPDDH